MEWTVPSSLLALLHLLIGVSLVALSGIKTMPPNEVVFQHYTCSNARAPGTPYWRDGREQMYVYTRNENGKNAHDCRLSTRSLYSPAVMHPPAMSFKVAAAVKAPPKSSSYTLP